MSARFNPTRALVATGALDDCVRVFNLTPLFSTSMSKTVDSSFLNLEETYLLVSELEEHPVGVNSVAWDSTGNRLLSGGEDSTVKIYKVINDDTTREISRYSIPGSRFWCVSIEILLSV